MRKSNTYVLQQNKYNIQQNRDNKSASKSKRKDSLRCKENTYGIDNYKFIQFIGKGTFGKVYSALDLKTQKRVAIKVVELFANYKNRQLDIIQKIQHPNCIGLLRYFTGYDHEAKKNKNYEFTLYLVMEQMDFSLSKYIQVKRKRSPILFSSIELKLICFQLLKALDYLDAKDICHRDLKPQNILINRQTLQVKICDYGSAKIIEAGEQNLAYICSRYYRAPQLLFGYTKYTPSVDMWSLGCIFLELLSGQPVFPGDSSIDQIIEIIKILGTPPKYFFDKVIKVQIQNFNFPIIHSLKLQRVLKKYKVQFSFIQMISKCLVYDWRKRLKSYNAFLQPFFDNLYSPLYFQYTQKLPSLFDFSHNLIHCPQKQKHDILKKFNMVAPNNNELLQNKENDTSSTQPQSH